VVFEPKVNRTRDMKTVLTAQLEGLREVLVGFQRSFEYVQDYVGIYGLRMFQEEFTRIMAFNTEQEANRFLRVRIPADTSRFQSTAIPLPLFLRPPEGDKTGSITFMGRLVHALVSLTDPRRTMYGPGCLGGAWHDGGGTELAGLSLFSLLNAAVGVPGLTGVDRLLGFNIEGQLRVLVRSYAAELKAGADAMLAGLADELAPTTSASPASLKRLGGLVKKLTKPMDALQEFLLNVGHWQLLRRAVAHELRFSCRLDSNMLVGSLEAMNTAVVSDIRRAFLSPDTAPMPEGAFPAAVAAYCESAGINDPLSNIYVTTEPLPHLGLWLALFVLTQIGKYAYDREFGTLLRRKATDAVDGAPLVAGLVTLLKQMPPRVTHDFLSYLGQYVRALLAASVANPAKPVGLPLEVVSAMLLARDVARVAHVPNRVLHSHFPPHLLETVGTGVGGL
jgi:WASH complex subunit strumpellin